MVNDALDAFKWSSATSRTQITTSVTSDVFDLGPGGTAPWRQMWANVRYSAANNASSSQTVIFTLEYTPDNGSNWFTLTDGAGQVITLTTSVQEGIVVLPFQLQGIPHTSTARKVRLKCTISTTSGTPTITYSADLNIGPL